MSLSNSISLMIVEEIYRRTLFASPTTSELMLTIKIDVQDNSPNHWWIESTPSIWILSHVLCNDRKHLVSLFDKKFFLCLNQVHVDRIRQNSSVSKKGYGCLCEGGPWESSGLLWSSCVGHASKLLPPRDDKGLLDLLEELIFSSF